jgi:hypothetical protein
MQPVCPGSLRPMMQEYKNSTPSTCK